MPEPKHYVIKAEGAAFTLNATADAKAIVRRPLPEDHPAYVLIGRIAAEWARLEHILDTIIWELAGLEPATGSCLTAPQFTYRPRLKMMRSLIEKMGLSADIISKAKQLNKDVGDHAYLRNQCVHDAWFVQEDSQAPEILGQFQSFTFSNKAYGFHPVSEGQMNDTIATIGNLIADALSLQAMLSAELATSRET